MALLIAALIMLPIMELFVIIEVGIVIGAWPTIGILLLLSLSGAWLILREGRSAWRRLSTLVSPGRVPAVETADGVLLIVAGILLLLPGFITATAGLALLIPAVRTWVRTFATARIVGGGWRGIAFAGATAAGSQWKSRQSGRPAAGPARRAYDIDGVAVDVDAPPLDR